MITHLRKTLVAGIVVLVPLIVTIKVLEVLFIFADGILGKALAKLLHVRIPGLGLLLFLVCIYVTGLVYRTFFGKNFIRWSENLVEKIPVARTIYSGVKQLLGPFTEEGEKKFSKAVLVEYPSPGIHTYAFLVNEDVLREGGREMVNVFIPSNHLHLGVVILVDRKSVIVLDASFEEIVRLMASFGAAAPRIKSLSNAGAKK